MIRSLKRFLFLIVLCLCVTVRAEDWSTYMHDPARSGVSGETLKLPLAPLWTYTPPAVPTRAWPDPQENWSELPKMTFDTATHVAIAGNTVYFGSPVDNGIHALDAATGIKRWTAFTDAPVRLAPTVVDGRVYAGSDDGTVYCLSARDGTPIWTARPFPRKERLLGAGRMMSISPIRTGILVDDGVAYCGAGLLPAWGTAVIAMDAATGKELWRSGNSSKAKKLIDPVPQGYLVASEKSLLVPRGRANPLFYARSNGDQTGALSDPSKKYTSKGIGGGTYGVFIDNLFYCGTQDSLCAAGDDGIMAALWGGASQLIATTNTWFRLSGFLGKSGQKQIPLEKNAIAAFDRSKVKSSGRIGKPPKDAIRWTYAGKSLRTIIAAGSHLFTGGQDAVAALDTATGKEVWRSPIEGVALALAAANGTLVVSADGGRIYGFGRAAPPSAAVRASQKADPFPQDAAAARIGALADAIAKDVPGPKRGFALIVGAGDAGARLARELERRTGMLAHVTDPDATRVHASRLALADARSYGNKVVVDLQPQGATALAAYPPYFANLVVVDADALGLPGTGPKEVMRVLKPCGGRLYAGPLTSSKTVTATDDSWTSGGTVSSDIVMPGTQGAWTRLVRGRLPGAGNWSHQFADAGNSASSEDTILNRQLNPLWYGEPGPDKMQDRHTGTQAPLFVDGRVYVQGIRKHDSTTLILCFDGYNGVPYWEREVPGAERLTVGNDCGNLAASAAGLFVATADACLHLDPNTGATVHTYTVPPRSVGAKAKWAFVAVVDNTLVGSSSPSYAFSDEVFAYDIVGGKLLWRHAAPVTRNATIAVNNGRVLFAENRNKDAAIPKVLTYSERIKAEYEKRRTDAQAGPPAKPNAAATPAYLRTAVALSLATGKELWSAEIDLTNCGSWGSDLCGAAKDDAYAFFGEYNAYGRGPDKEVVEARRVLVLDAKDGKTLWNKPFANYVRPLISGDRLVARPNAFYLKTGEPVLMANSTKPWNLGRLGACGQMSASSDLLFYRYGYTMMVDQKTLGKTSFLGMRPGCYINTIPAGGIVIQPEASSGCVCDSAAVQCTIAFVPSKAR